MNAWFWVGVGALIAGSFGLFLAFWCISLLWFFVDDS